MKATSKILVLAISMAITAPAYADLLKAHPSRTYPVIKACLEKVGLVEGDDFRRNPEKQDLVQLRNGLFDEPQWKREKATIDACWKKQ